MIPDRRITLLRLERAFDAIVRGFLAREFAAVVIDEFTPVMPAAVDIFSLDAKLKRRHACKFAAQDIHSTACPIACRPLQRSDSYG
jgi:hypothetical protein